MQRTLKDKIDWLKLKGVSQHREGVDMMAIINELVARLEVARDAIDLPRNSDATVRGLRAADLAVSFDSE